MPPFRTFFEKPLDGSGRDGCAQLVFLARDADPALTARVREQCRAQGVEVAEGFTMRELGQAAGIQVGAAVAAVLKS